MAVREATKVAPLLCRLVTIVAPVAFVPLMRGQNRNVTELAVDDDICAEKLTAYSPASLNTMRLDGVPLAMPSEAVEV